MSKVFQSGGWILSILFLSSTLYLATSQSRPLDSTAKTDPLQSQEDGELSLRLRLAQREALLTVAQELQASCESGTPFAGTTLSASSSGEGGDQGDMDEQALTQALDTVEARIVDTLASLMACQDAGPPIGEEMTEEVDDSVEEMPKAHPETSVSADAEKGKTSMERAAQAQMELLMDMVYGDLYQELGLSPEQEERVKKAIVANSNEYRSLTVKAMRSGEQTAREVRGKRDGLRAKLRSELASFLDREALAAFDQYELVADQILYERTVEGQLAMLASGLSSENRQLTSQIMAEELVRAFDTFDQTNELYTVENFNGAQAQALNSSLERLASTMPEEQFAFVQGFVNQALAVFNASTTAQ